ncbi:hypothetical protein RB195_015000 [Necator americanus]|uniref:Uncharacterized protein n=1 Tax=Necator americanus TaxID=51031 RepID=A0ABR1E2R5_NECAM
MIVVLRECLKCPVFRATTLRKSGLLPWDNGWRRRIAFMPKIEKLGSRWLPRENCSSTRPYAAADVALDKDSKARMSRMRSSGTVAFQKYADIIVIDHQQAAWKVLACVKSSNVPYQVQQVCSNYGAKFECDAPSIEAVQKEEGAAMTESS